MKSYQSHPQLPLSSIQSAVWPSKMQRVSWKVVLVWQLALNLKASMIIMLLITSIAVAANGGCIKSFMLHVLQESWEQRAEEVDQSCFSFMKLGHGYHTKVEFPTYGFIPCWPDLLFQISWTDWFSIDKNIPPYTQTAVLVPALNNWP